MKQDGVANIVAVYGSLRKGFGNHDNFLGKHQCIGQEFTEDKFRMYSLGSFPCIKPDAEGYPVMVELYLIDNHLDLPRLDRLEGVPHLYKRGIIDTSKGLAYIYYMDSEGRPDWNQGEITSGDWEDSGCRRGAGNYV